MHKIFAIILLFFAASSISFAAGKDKATRHIKLTYKAYWGGLDDMITVYSEFPIGWGKVRVYLAGIEVTTE